MRATGGKNGGRKPAPTDFRRQASAKLKNHRMLLIKCNFLSPSGRREPHRVPREGDAALVRNPRASDAVDEYAPSCTQNAPFCTQSERGNRAPKCRQLLLNIPRHRRRSQSHCPVGAHHVAIGGNMKSVSDTIVAENDQSALHCSKIGPGAQDGTSTVIHAAAVPRGVRYAPWPGLVVRPLC